MMKCLAEAYLLVVGHRWWSNRGVTRSVGNGGPCCASGGCLVRSFHRRENPGRYCSARLAVPAKPGITGRSIGADTCGTREAGRRVTALALWGGPSRSSNEHRGRVWAARLAGQCAFDRPRGGQLNLMVLMFGNQLGESDLADRGELSARRDRVQVGRCGVALQHACFR